MSIAFAFNVIFSLKDYIHKILIVAVFNDRLTESLKMYHRLQELD